MRRWLLGFSSVLVLGCAARSQDMMTLRATETEIDEGPGARWSDASWDPAEPEHYIVDERVRVKGKDSGVERQQMRGEDLPDEDGEAPIDGPAADDQLE